MGRRQRATEAKRILWDAKSKKEQKELLEMFMDCHPALKGLTLDKISINSGALSLLLDILWEKRII